MFWGHSNDTTNFIVELTGNGLRKEGRKTRDRTKGPWSFDQMDL